MIVTKDTLPSIINELSAPRVLALDTETSGLDWEDRLFSIIISDEFQDYYFDTRVLGDLSALSILFNDPFKIWVFKNAKFDMRMLRHEGFEIVGWVEDIGIAARILNNDFYGAKAYSLAALAKREGLEKLDIVDRYIKENKLYEVRKTRLDEPYKQPQFDKVPLDIIAEYACKDSRLTYDLRRIYSERMDSDDRLIYDNECQLIKVCFDMEWRGLRLDVDYTRKGFNHEQEELKKKKRHFLQATGKEYEDKKSVLVPLFAQAGEQIPETDKGNPSLTDDILETFISPVAKIVQGIRYHEKRISTYYKNYIEGHDKGSVIHPSMWQEGTRTGRFSYSNPNLQNIPKEEGSEDPYVIRGCFVPTRGNTFISFDFSQMEYRLLLAYANEDKLIKEVMNGKDLHQATAELLGVSRSFAKTLNFAILYGAGIEKLSRMLSVPPNEAARLRTKYQLGLPRVEQLVADIIRTGRSRGFVKSLHGRKLRADSEFAYALVNHLIQGSCADIVKIAMNKVGVLLEGTQSSMVLQVHDQLLIDCNPDDYGLMPKVKEIMENVFPATNGMRLIVDVEWSTKSFAERDFTKGIPSGEIA